MDNQRDIEYYESHVGDVKLEDITSDENNADILAGFVIMMTLTSLQYFSLMFLTMILTSS